MDGRASYDDEIIPDELPDVAPMERANLADLLARKEDNSPRVDTEEVPIPALGKSVLVRGLSRYEFLGVGKGVGEGDTAVVERRMIALAMLEPKMTIDEVATWQRSSAANEMTPVIKAINKLSGIGKTEEKEAYKSFRASS